MLHRHCIVFPSPGTVAPSEWAGAILRHCRALARWLHAEGCTVTLLHPDPQTRDEPEDTPPPAGWEEITLPPSTSSLSHLPHCPAIERSMQVAKYLSQHEFDAVHFQDWRGTGMLPLQHRRTLGLPGAPLIITTVHGGTEQEFTALAVFPAGTAEHAMTCHAERYSAHHADGVILPHPESAALLEEQGWQFPATRWQLPLLDAPAAPDTTAWRAWLASAAVPASLVRGHRPPPQITVCMAHHNHAAYLAAALDSLATQTREDFAVIVVDDGSTHAASADEFTRLETYYRDQRPSWRFLRAENRGASAARNHAARLATTEYVVFMDSDNVAHPEMLEVMARAIARTGSDALSCHFYVFHGDGAPEENTWSGLYHALGACLEAGFLVNVLGDTNFIIRRQVFLKLGGFTEERGFSLEDWEFLARLVLAGHELDAIPRPLFYYRHLQDSFNRRESSYINHRRMLRPMLNGLPHWIQRSLMGWFGSEGPYRTEAKIRIASLEAEVAQLHQKLAQMKDKRREDRTRLDTAVGKINRLREKLNQRNTARAGIGQKLRELLFPKP